MTLVEFLTAMLDRDEAVAKASGEARIAWLTYLDNEGRMRYTSVAAEAGDGNWVAAGEKTPDPAHTLVVYDPARVLRGIATHRRILELHSSTHECFGYGNRVSDPEYQDGTYGGPCDTLRLLALDYDDHEDYDEEWRP